MSRWRRPALALLAALAVPAVGAGGCGGESSRERVADYIREANGVQRSAAPRFEQANRTYAAFAKGETTGAAAARRLARVEADIAAARKRTATLATPPEARELRRRLMAIYAGNAGLAHEATQLAAYTPAAKGAVQPLERVNRRLLRTLRSEDGIRAQERGMRAYGAALAAMVADLRALDPPPVLEPAHRVQVRRLASISRLARRLADALGDEDPKAVARRLVAFRRAARSAPAVDGAQRAAMRAYERRTDALNRAYAALQREHARLNGTLD